MINFTIPYLLSYFLFHLMPNKISPSRSSGFYDTLIGLLMGYNAHTVEFFLLAQHVLPQIFCSILKSTLFLKLKFWFSSFHVTPSCTQLRNHNPITSTLIFVEQECPIYAPQEISSCYGDLTRKGSLVNWSSTFSLLKPMGLQSPPYPDKFSIVAH